MELNARDTRYVSGENSYAQWYEPITVFKLGLPGAQHLLQVPSARTSTVILIVTYLFRENCYVTPVTIRFKILIHFAALPVYIREGACPSR